MYICIVLFCSVAGTSNLLISLIGVFCCGFWGRDKHVCMRIFKSLKLVDISTTVRDALKDEIVVNEASKVRVSKRRVVKRV